MDTTQIASIAPVTIIHGPDYLPALTHEIRRAAKSIIGAHYMIRPADEDDAHVYRTLWHELYAAPRRVPECRLAINARFQGPKMGAYNHEAAHRLALAGWRIRTTHPQITAHSKVWIFDNERVLLGSSNIGHDPRHPVTNTNLLIEGRSIALRLLTTFNDTWAGSRDFTPANAQPAAA